MLRQLIEFQVVSALSMTIGFIGLIYQNYSLAMFLYVPVVSFFFIYLGLVLTDPHEDQNLPSHRA